jgi:hypothetical protein
MSDTVTREQAIAAWDVVKHHVWHATIGGDSDIELLITDSEQILTAFFEQAPAAPVEGKLLYEGPVTVGEERHGGAFVRVNIPQTWKGLVQTRRAHVRVNEIEGTAHE